MAYFYSLYTCREFDKDGRQYDINLPHGKQIVDHFCHEWNQMVSMMTDMINKVCDNRIESCYMRQYDKKSGKTTLAVVFKAKEGKKLTRWIKDEIIDFMSGQWSDGFGECVFREYTDPDTGETYVVD